MDNLIIKKIYSYESKFISDYNKNNLKIGDILIGDDILICVGFTDMKLLQTSYQWGKYILLVCELLNINKKQNLRIFTNNNNTLLKYTSLETSNTILKTLVVPLKSYFDNIEIC